MERGNYFDFHTHILPGVDDGAKNWEMTRSMLEASYAQGVTTVIATPHQYPGGRKQRNSQIRELCLKADRMAKEIHSSMRVLPGNEIYFRWNLQKELIDDQLLTLAGTPYLLIEFSTEETFEHVCRGIQELTEAGYYPVIAHVERVESLFWEPEHLERLIRMGCYLQANCEDFMGGLWDKTAIRLRKLLAGGKIHFLGSDCHNTTTRPPFMEDCVRRLEKKLPQDAVDRVIRTNTARFMEKKYI